MALDDEAVAWSLLRGESELDGRRGDIDFLVDPTDIARFDRVAHGLGFARLPSAGYGSHGFQVAYDEPTGCWLKLDTVTELAFGPAFALVLPAPTTAACLDRRRRVGPVFVLAPGDAFWTLLLHGLLDKSAVDEATRLRLGELAPEGRAGGPVATGLASLVPDGWSLERVVEAVSVDDWAGLADLGPKVASTWRGRQPLSTLRRRAAGPVQLRAGRLARVRRPRGLGVALVGDPDLTARLAARLAGTVPLPARMPTLPPASRSLARGVRDRLRLAQCLVIFRAATLENLPDVWTRDRPAGRSGVAEALSSPAPDLVVLLGAAGVPPTETVGPPGIRAAVPLDIRTVDASVAEEQLSGIVAGLIWERLAERWNALDGRSTENRT